MNEDLKNIIKSFYSEIINKGNLSIINTIMSESFIDHNIPPEAPNGIEGFIQFLRMVSTAFPDIQVTVQELIAENNMVVSRLSITGTQTGILMGKIAPTNKKAVWTGIDIFKIENGKITDRWSQRDLLSMMKQIGAIPQ